MSNYIINKTDGSILTEVVDGKIDQSSSDVTLVGKNASSYGEFFNENFVHILENFANTSAPNHPLQGQLWYDTSEGRLKVYDGNGFKVSGGTIVSNSVPSTIAQGDIWIDSHRQQMYFNDGISTNLAGPVYTKQQGISGFQTIDIIDTNVISHTIVLLYVAQVLIGIFSKDAFTPATAIPGYTGSIKIGFNVSNYSGVTFNVAASSAELLSAADGSFKTAESFLSTTDNTATIGTLSIVNSTPLILGLNSNTEIGVGNGLFQISSNIQNQNFEINSLSSAGLEPSIFIEAATRQVGIYTDTPSAMLDVAGDVRIRGGLIVEGESTIIHTNHIEVEDLLIQLGVVANPSNATADGGGMLVEAGLDGDKKIIWMSSDNSWTSSDNFNLVASKGFYVNDNLVINETSLGIGVTSAPGITSLGTLTALQVSNLFVSGNTISYVNPSSGIGDVTLLPKGTGTVNVSNKQISNVAEPTALTSAATLGTVTFYTNTAPHALSINVGALSDAQIASNILSKVLPEYDHQDGAICRVWCLDLFQAKEFTIIGNTWQFTANI